jgi:hypothetical protein
MSSCEKTAFLSHSYIKPIILPRQARDKHRESTQKKMCRFSHLQLADTQPVAAATAAGPLPTIPAPANIGVKNG